MNRFVFCIEPAKKDYPVAAAKWGVVPAFRRYFELQFLSLILPGINH